MWVCSPRFHPLCPKLPSFNQIHLQDLSCFSWILGHPSQHQTWPVHICFLQTYWCPLIPVFPLISSPFHTFLHLRRLCSDKEDFLLQCSRMSEFLTARGYPPHQSLKTNWDAQNRSPGPVPLIWLHRLQTTDPSSLCFSIHTTSQSAGFSGQTGTSFKTALQLARPFVIGLWWFSRKIGTYVRFSYTPTSAVMLPPHQAHSPAPLTGVRHAPTCALTPLLKVPMVTCLLRGLSCVRVTTWSCQSCNLIYVGETSRSLVVHFSEHLAEIHHNCSKPVAQHFKLPVIPLRMSKLTHWHLYGAYAPIL